MAAVDTGGPGHAVIGMGSGSGGGSSGGGSRGGDKHPPKKNTPAILT